MKFIRLLASLLIFSTGCAAATTPINNPVASGVFDVSHVSSWTGQIPATAISGLSSGSVSAVTIVTANGVSGSVANQGTTPAITITLGAITPSSINTGGQITSTLAIGTAPFVVTSTTNVANLNASSLNGATFAAPGAIGSGTASTGAFTTITTSGAVVFNANSSALPSPLSGTILQIGQANGTNTRFMLDAFGAAPIINFRTAAGTNASKTAVQNGGAVGQIAAYGYGATAYSSNYRAAIALLAAENWTDSAQGTSIEVDVTTPGSLTGVVAGLFTSTGLQAPIGATTANTGAFTTVHATGQITSTLTTGTAPLVVASTTNVANLNASQLLGSTWVAPGAIGSTTPNTGAFTSLTTTTATNNYVIIEATNVGAEQGIKFNRNGTDTWTMADNNVDAIYFNRGGSNQFTIAVGGITVLGSVTIGSTTLLTSTVALTNGAAAASGTLTNAPTAGNPSKWVPINDNGTTRYIPAW